MARFCPLFSGSSGNSYYIGSAAEGVLVDVGRSAKQVTQALSRCGIDPAAVKAVFVTHEHSDHVAGLRVFASRFHLPIFTSQGTLEALKQMNCFSCGVSAEAVSNGGVDVAGMEVVPFSIPHDSVDCVGYRITTADGQTAAFSTDLGCVSDEIREKIYGADLVVIESNHDVGMLQNGPYPYPLKRRILSNTGHLSNDACAAELGNFVRKGSTRLVLAHLSRENNTPELAYQTSLCALSMAGMKQGEDFELYVAPKENTENRMILF